MATLKDITEEVRKVVDDDSARELRHKKWPTEKFVKEILPTIKDEHWQDIRDYFAVAIEVGSDEVLQYGEKMLEKRKLIKWKEHPEIFDTIFECLIKYGGRSNSEKEFWHPTDYMSVVDKTALLLKSLQMSKKYSDRFYEIIVVAFSSADNKLLRAVVDCMEALQWVDYPERIQDIADKTFKILDENPEMGEAHNVTRTIESLWPNIFRHLMGNDAKTKKVAVTIAPNLAKSFVVCSKQDWIDADDMDERNANWQMLKIIMEDYLSRHHDETAVIRPFFPTIMELRECEDDTLKDEANSLFESIGSNIAELMGDDIGVVIDGFIEKADMMKMHQLHEAYKGHKEAFKDRINDIMEAIMGNKEIWTQGMAFAGDVAKDYPEQFNAESIKGMVDTLEEPATYSQGLVPITIICQSRKQEILQYDDAILACMKRHHGMGSRGTEVLVQLASIGKDHAVKYIREMVGMIKEVDQNFAINLVYYVKVIGEPYPEELEKYKEVFEELLKNPQIKDHAQSVLDVIEGRSLQTISKEVQDQKADIDDLDTRVTGNEAKVDDLEQGVTTLNQDVGQLKTEVNEQGEKIYELEVAVEETQDKVEEIDKKTLSHAPVWSRDVARLMNEEHEYDWRFLATKLGYSNDDIRNWATQPDPCLSLLDEWFATHKTRDATFAVEQALNDMNRTDAAMIVENALKQTEGVVEDDEDEAWDPPPIFISYQWGHQQEVKLLHKHLEMAGYKSWMDIGQMGGGDKLFEKIDRGIRAAKVVICCVSEKYAKSPNCNREVNLAVTLGKPMIPLLMEKLAWPPPGAMGPIFGEYIFVRFFARPGETAGDDRYWPTAKFQEMLMQLRYTHAPEDEIITEPYKEWWSPPEEIISIKPKEDKPAAKSNAASSSDDSEESASPDVFISYQWGKQPQIKKLYETLTKQGYYCWLDIMQMGGGDSLYDKIDKGIRGCKVVISCVTSKYALSANCRREVSLADAIKKPIIPLLLEKSTWPPAGPMSMVFTQLLYIDFCSPDVEIQNHWDCPQMGELYAKLAGYAPSIGGQVAITNGDDSNDKNDNKNNENTTQKDTKSEDSKPNDISANGSDDNSKPKQNTEKSESQTEKADKPESQTEKKTDEKPKSSSCTLL